MNHKRDDRLKMTFNSLYDNIFMAGKKTNTEFAENILMESIQLKIEKDDSMTKYITIIRKFAAVCL